MLPWQLPVPRLLDTIVGAALAEAAEPIFTAVGGGAALGSALRCAWEMRYDAPRWDRATAYGAVAGAAFGATILMADMLSIA